MELFILVLVIWLVFIINNRLYRRFLFKNFTYRCYFTKQEVCEGDDLELVEELTNAKWLPIPWLKTDFSLPRYLLISKTRSVVTDKTRFFSSFFMVKGQHSIKRSWSIHCERRGVFEIEKVIAVASDLFGNEIQSQVFPVNISLTVLPNPTFSDIEKLNPVQLTGLTPVRRSLTQNPFELIGAREYTDRDPMNKIDWLATARTKSLMVRETAFSASPKLAVLLNIQSSAGERDFAIDEQPIEAAIKLCAGLFYHAATQDIPFSFYCNAPISGDTVHTHLESGMAHVMRHLRLLAALPLRNSRDFSEFLVNHRNELEGFDVVVISAYLGGKLNEVLENLGHPTVFTACYDESLFPSNCDIYQFSWDKKEDIV